MVRRASEGPVEGSGGLGHSSEAPEDGFEKPSEVYGGPQYGIGVQESCLGSPERCLEGHELGLVYNAWHGDSVKPVETISGGHKEESLWPGEGTGRPGRI